MKKETKQKMLLDTCDQAGTYLKNKFKKLDNREFIFFLDMVKRNAMFDEIDKLDERLEERLMTGLTTEFKKVKEGFDEVEKEIEKLKKELKK